MRATPDEILGMAYFARVVEARSFTDAARSLGVSKSAVSARVARLEESLGVQLLHRTTRRLALTADGVRLYERCARVVAEADEAAEVGAGASAVPRGTLRVSAPSGISQLYLTKAIADFMAAHPTMRVDLRVSDRIPDLAADEIDIALVVAGRLPDSGLSTRMLGSVRMAVCAAPAYLRRKGIPFRPQDLVLHDCVSHSIRQGVDDLRFETDEGAVSMTSLSKLVADDARFLREAAIAGLGIVVVPELLVEGDLGAGRLHRVLDDFPSIELGAHALHPHGRLPPASVRAFLEHLVALFRAPPWETRVAAPPRRPSPGKGIPLTEQDTRRLNAVAALYADVEAAAAASLRERVELAKVLPVAKIPRTAVTMNSRVRLRTESGHEREVSLAYPWEASGDRVSVLGGLGRKLLGAKVGTAVTHDGKTSTIAAIPYQPEAAGDHHL